MLLASSKKIGLQPLAIEPPFEHYIRPPSDAPRIKDDENLEMLLAVLFRHRDSNRGILHICGRHLNGRRVGGDALSQSEDKKQRCCDT